MNDSSMYQEELRRIADHILGGGVAAVPTETVYGLLCDASSPVAVEKLRAMKGKPSWSPIPIFIPPQMDLRSLTPDPAECLLALEKAYWPGPLLIVCEPSKTIADMPVCKDGRVGLRKSSSAIINMLIEFTGKYLTATSANLSGIEPALSEEDIKMQFGSTDLLIMDKPTSIITADKPSTVVAFEGDQLIILREGVITIKEIAEKLAGCGVDIGIRKIG